MAKEDTIVVHEIYKSIQGESRFAGLPCVFVRTTGCNLRCTWCDTPQAFYGGTRLPRADVRRQVQQLDTKLVEVTGGEPLLQPAVRVLLSELAEAGHDVLLETSGEADIGGIDPRVVRIMDWKPPGSGESERMRVSNLAHLTPRDEVKFVIADRRDYEWMRDQIRLRAIASRTPHLLASTVFGRLAPRDLVAWVLEDNLPVRVQLQLHKYIWSPDAQGV